MPPRWPAPTPRRRFVSTSRPPARRQPCVSTSRAPAPPALPPDGSATSTAWLRDASPRIPDMRFPGAPSLSRTLVRRRMPRRRTERVQPTGRAPSQRASPDPETPFPAVTWLGAGVLRDSEVALEVLDGAAKRFPQPAFGAWAASLGRGLRGAREGRCGPSPPESRRPRNTARRERRCARRAGSGRRSAEQPVQPKATKHGASTSLAIGDGAEVPR